MANNSFLTTTELDFEGIKQSLKTYLQGQTRFADYDFDGSNISVLLDILAYNTYLNSFYLNMVGSEMFLDTAQLRESVVSHAKELNYIPRSRTSARALVNVTVVPNDLPNSIVIPKFYKFTTRVDNQTLTFSTGSEVIINRSDDSYVAANVEIYEGDVVTEYFTNVANQRFILNSDSVDTNSIEVTIIASNTDSTSAIWTRADNLYGLDGSSNVFFIQGYSADQYEIVFGNGVLGRALSTGNIVKVVYRDTLGEPGNGLYSFSKTDAIDGYTNISVETVTTSAEGAERETVDDIKFNGPRFFTTQERAVTAFDYIALVKARFPQLQSVIAYGGEELDPPQYGKVGISVKPYGSAGIISNNLKNQIVAYLNQKSLTTEPVVIDPDYYYIDIRSSVRYNTTATSYSTSQIRALVESTIAGVANSSLSEFGSDLRYSKLVAAIDDADPSIVSNETDLRLIKRWSPAPGFPESVTFTFGNPLYSEDVAYRPELTHSHTMTVESTPFVYTTSTGTQYNCYIGDDYSPSDNNVGVLNLYTNQRNSNNVVERIIVQSNIGTVNYDDGSISLTTTVTSYIGRYISIYGRPLNKDLYAEKNIFLLIDSADVDITVVPVVV